MNVCSCVCVFVWMEMYVDAHVLRPFGWLNSVLNISIYGIRSNMRRYALMVYDFLFRTIYFRVNAALSAVYMDIR